MGMVIIRAMMGQIILLGIHMIVGIVVVEVGMTEVL
jgi:hypothetical protein